jgi:anti-sigma regulatory factor (Ser/Thr protein kinase)
MWTFRGRRTSSQEPSVLNLMLTEEIGAAAAARQALREENGTLPAPIRDDILLLVSELVTNAVRHAGAGPERPLHVQLLRGPRWVVVAVADGGPGFTWHPTRPSGANESGGWGLFLVDQIADRWGVECTTSGSCVWFEIAYEE